MVRNILEMVRAGKGNPNHVASGEKGGQFTSGPGGGAAHGKHWAKRQRRKERQKRQGKKKVQRFANAAKRKVNELKAEHRTERRDVSTRQRKEKQKLESEHAAQVRKHEANALTEKHILERKQRAERVKESSKSGLSDRERKGKPAILSAKAQKAQAHQTKTTAVHQTYAKGNEFTFAKRMEGSAFADNGPVDVELKIGNQTHGIELKTITHGKNDKITMKGEALERKAAYKKEGKELHTVVLDHRDRFGETPHLHSGHEMYYKRGAGSYRLGSMHKVKNEAELKELMAMPNDQLPVAARGKE